MPGYGVRAGGELLPFDEVVQVKSATDMSGMLDEQVFAVRPAKVIGLDETFNADTTRWTSPA